MKKIKIEIKWGILFSIATLVWIMIEKMVGLHDIYISKHALYSNLYAIVAILIFVLALKDKKNHFFDGNMTWKQGFLSGVVLSIVIAILSILVQYISFTFITIRFFENMIKYVVSNKIQTQEQAIIYFSLRSYIIQGIFGSLSMGVVTSAAIAFILKSKIKPN